MTLLTRTILFVIAFIPLLQLQADELPVEVIAVEKAVEKSKDGKTWGPTKTGDRLDYGDHIRTGEYSRVALRFPSGNVIRLSEFSNMRLAKAATENPEADAGTHLKAGALYFFSRFRDSESDVNTPAVNAAIRGTEFEVRVLKDGSTQLNLFDGQVSLSNTSGTLEMGSGEISTTALNRKPVKAPMIDASQHIQWYLYYPAILDTGDLQLSATALQDSLAAYRAGNILRALELLPTSASGDTATKIYRANLILASGQVEAADQLLQSIKHPAADALRELIATVKGSRQIPSNQPNGATAWLARSYTLQANEQLTEALEAARKATTAAPNFGYAWSRLARLYFSVDDIDGMQHALKQAEAISPENAEVFTLKGFHAAAVGDMASARTAFEQAISIAPGYADAWLGLGLVRFNQGEEAAALQDLLAAAALEPNRSILRSYLAKAFAEKEQGRFPLESNESTAKAVHELELAKALDPADPTPWLYSALVKQKANRPNEAIADLQKSIRLNDNRSLFRSKLLLDRDLAVRQSNLADVYNQAGLPTQALTEAGKAVTNDYLNFSSHDFLQQAYTKRLDPTRLAQRYDTVVSNELFLRNILAPVGAGIASQRVTEQEYSSFFDQTGWSGSTSASYDSRERTEFSLFATYAGDKYAAGIELLKRDWDEHHFNDHLEEDGALVHFKYDFTEKDRIYAMLLYNHSEQGDVRYTPNLGATSRAVRDYTIDPDGRTIFSATTTSGLEIDPVYGRDPELEVRQWQEPLAFLSYAREWNEENTTLFLFGRTDLHTEIDDPLQPALSINNSTATPFLRTYESSLYSEQSFLLHSGEIQHILSIDKTQFILGARYQAGDIEDEVEMKAAIVDTTPPVLLPTIVPYEIDSVGSSSDDYDFTRWSAYGYVNHELDTDLTLIAALTYEHIDFADGLWNAPRTDSRQETGQFSPKLGFVWQPKENMTLRGAWSRSLSGYSIEDQLRLEPSQVAGLASTYRSLVPTQVTGTMAGGTNDSFTLNFNVEFNEQTFGTIEAFYGEFSGKRAFGIFEETVAAGTFPNDPGELTIGEYNQEIDYSEYSLLARLDHLLDNRTSIGTSLFVQHATIDETIDAPALGATNPLLDDTEATLYTASVYGRYQLPQGWFLNGELQYWLQDNNNIDLDDASMPMVNLSIGRRLQNQKGAITFTVYNLTDEDDGLNPINYFNAPPDERTFVIQFNYGF
ncbi:MAG: TonB-dependent receptor domain-containing protein [Opitutaceae bacterium]